MAGPEPVLRGNGVFETLLRRHRISRREAIGLGAAAAAGALLGPRAALGAARPRCSSSPLADEAARAAAAGGWRTTRGPARAAALRPASACAGRAAPALAAQVRRAAARRRVEPLGAAARRRRPRAGRRAAGRRHRAGVDGRRRLLPAAPARPRAGLRVRFVRGARRRPRGGARRAAARARGRARRSSPQRWGGDSVPPRSPPAYGRCSSASSTTRSPRTTTGPRSRPAIVLGIARYHRDSNGWNDIGYNFVVDQYGQIFEARAGGVDQAVVGAQAQGYNSVSTGIACLGTFESVAFRRPAWRRSRTCSAGSSRCTACRSRARSRSPRPAARATATQRHAGHVRAHLRPSRRDARAAPAGCSTASCPTCAAGALRYATPVSRVTLHSAARRVRGGSPPR